MKKIIDWILSLFKKTEKKKLSPIQIGATQTWYGRVNTWWKSSSLWEKEMNAIVKSGGSGYMIELAGWQSHSAKDWWSESWIKKQLSLYSDIHKAAKKRGLWLFVSIVNDNMGSGKYGDKKQFTVANTYDKCVKLLEGIVKDGNANVVIQPVAETQTAAGKKFESYAKSQLQAKGFLTCFNGNGGYPSGSSGCNFFAVHPSKIATPNPSSALVISDHGLIIRELNQGGSLVAHGDPAKIATFVANNKKKGCPVVGYYAFQVEDYDECAIKALGQAAK